jgi:hypothetical protein
MVERAVARAKTFTGADGRPERKLTMQEDGRKRLKQTDTSQRPQKKQRDEWPAVQRRFTPPTSHAAHAIAVAH